MSAMATSKLSSSERKDLDKYTKFLALKSIQIIVQSRLGDKVQTHCKPQSTGSDWFSLAINDLTEVSAEAKKVLNGDSILNWLPLSVEISLKTTDGDQMVLENWNLGIQTDQCDPSVKMPCTIYNRMSLMLKSLISVTRATPAYKLSRRQGPDSFVVYYRVYLGEPQYHILGEGYKQFKVGQLCTPIGVIYMSVAYRTKMTITPIQTQEETSIMVKSDHFHSDLSPKHNRYTCKQSCDKKKINLDEPMRAGAFVDTSKVKQYESDFILPEVPPYSWLLADPQMKNDNLDFSKSDPCDNPFSPHEDFQFESDKEASDECSNSTDRTNGKASIWTMGPDDDKLMKELPLPFATAGPLAELATFYRECYYAPPLQSFTEIEAEESKAPPKEDPTKEITKQLEMFETSLHEYEQMVSSLCQSPNNN